MDPAATGDFQTLIPSVDMAAAIGCDFMNGNITWDCITSYIFYLSNVILVFLLGGALFNLILNGYRYAIGPVFGQGTNEGAKNGIKFSLLAVAIGLLAYLIVDVVFVALSTP